MLVKVVRGIGNSCQGYMVFLPYLWKKEAEERGLGEQRHAKGFSNVEKLFTT